MSRPGQVLVCTNSQKKQYGTVLMVKIRAVVSNWFWQSCDNFSADLDLVITTKEYPKSVRDDSTGYNNKYNHSKLGSDSLAISISTSEVQRRRGTRSRRRRRKHLRKEAIHEWPVRYEKWNHSWYLGYCMLALIWRKSIFLDCHTYVQEQLNR